MRVLGICLLLAGLSAPATAAAPQAWQAGAASVVITPTGSLWMAGYASRNKPADGKVQDLFAKALALQDEQGQQLLIVTLDLIGVPQPVRHRLAARVQQVFGVPPQFFLLNASHTHSGPLLRGAVPTAKEFEDERIRSAFEYTQWLEEKLCQLVGDALAKLEPARLTWSRARSGFAVNRRLPTPQGYRLGFNPDGPVDHEVPVLSVERAGGELLAMMFGYACHNTCLGEYSYCGDYAGYAQEYLQAGRKDFTAIFLMGCAGDQSPQNPNRRGPGAGPPRLAALDLAKQHGRALAIAAEMANIGPQREVGGPLRAAYEEVKLDYEKEKGRPPHSYPVQIIAFGRDLTLVALGSEAVVDYSLRIKKELAGEAAVWVSGYSNDYSGYIPSLRVLREGGYEANAGWADSIEERILGKVRELHVQLFFYPLNPNADVPHFPPTPSNE